MLLLAGVAFSQSQTFIPMNNILIKSDLCVVNNNLVYVLMRDSGVYVSNAGNAVEPANIPIAANEFYAMVHRNDTLWVGTSSGLFRVAPGGVVQRFSAATSNFSADTVFDIGLLASGRLLAATNAGLVLLSGSSFTTLNTTNSVLTNNRVTHVSTFDERAGLIANNTAFSWQSGAIQAVSGFNTTDTLLTVQPISLNRIILGTQTQTFVSSLSGGFDSLPGVSGVRSTAFTASNEVLLLGLSSSRVRLFTFSPQFNDLQFRNVALVGSVVNSLNPAMMGLSPNGRLFAINRLALVFYEGIQFFEDAPNSFNRRELDVNNVRAMYLNGGDMFWDRNNTAAPRYNVPKDAVLSNNSKHSLFAFSPWFGGMHGGQLYQSAQTYRQVTVGGIVYRSGPLTATGERLVNEGEYDRLWKIDRREIEFFKDAWSRGAVQNGTFVPTKDLREWPGNRPGGGVLAPYFDRNNDGQYRWQDGDYPLIKGDQAVWMVFNDRAPRNQVADPLSLEVHCMAYAYTCSQLSGADTVLNYTTFLDYKVHNRSNRTYNNTFISLWTDGDLGNQSDDYVGMDVKGNGYYFYNGDDDDEGVQGYGFNPPAQGIYVLKGPTAPSADGIDNNRNGVIDEVGEDLALSSFVYFNNDASPIGNPTTSQDFYNYSRAIWKDNTPMVYGGTGYPASMGSTTLPAKFMFPGATDSTGWGLGGTTASPVIAPFQWSEVDPGPGASPNVPADRRGLASMGPFNFNAGGTESFTVAFIYSRGNNGANSSRLKLLNQDAPRIKQWFAQNQFPSCLDLTGLSIGEVQQPRLQVNMFPNPSKGRVSFRMEDDAPTTIELFDMQGRKLQTQHFSGETTYQLNVDQLPAGMYLVHVKQAKGMAMLKLLLQP